ncbi:hypothetical protein KSS87_017244 [Heliosperma pusillum]|nr:hypothetical protein KSS87_017244 [Heliosperma pusillum]
MNHYTTNAYCGAGCQSQCARGGGPSRTSWHSSPSGGGDVASIITPALFDQMLKHRNGFYTYDAFIVAARSFPGFGTTKQELAAFFAQTSHETIGGWNEAPDGPYAWGYCFVIEQYNRLAYCDSHSWSCPAGEMYYGRGPIQLTQGVECGRGYVASVADCIGNTLAEQCGKQANNALCPNGLCCSQFGFCGTTNAYCGAGCQSQCGGGSSPTPSTPAPSGGGDVASIITPALFNQMLLHRNENSCPAHGFYTYDAFIAAARFFPGFGTTKQELAAFFGQTSHETTGGWPTAPDGPYSWGYCFLREQGNPPAYCDSSSWPCPAGKAYYGRGPIQLTHNYNYGLAGNAIKVDLINNPDLVATDPTISFKTAIWFWMTPQANKPSCHSVITGSWSPSAADQSAGRAPGFGVITNIINGGIECGHGSDPKVADRIGFYKRYCDLLGIGYGNNLDCYSQRPFA